MATFNILYLSSEIAPFAKIGGLADVANSYPRYLKDKEHDIRVLIPKYKMIRDRRFNLREVIRLRDIEVPMGDDVITVSVKSGFIPDSKVQAYFLEYKPFFDRPDIYVDPKNCEGWPDNHMRFALFSRTAFEMLKVLYWQPDVIHVNDWPGALVPYYLKTVYKDDPFFANIRTVLTIHNQAYQGEFDAKVASEIGANSIPFDKNHPAWHNGQFNFLKAGILSADIVTTVSPTYAREIITNPELGCGLSDTLSQLGDKFVGILNGIDDNRWSPEKDKFITAPYSLENLAPKKDNRKELCERFGLQVEPDAMLIGMISRLVAQKGFDLLEEAIGSLMKHNIVLVILGKGHPDVQAILERLMKAYPDKIVAKFAYDSELAHMIEAGADTFLIPSRYEPCGLNQMYSQRYGTPPIVHSAGGLADTVKEFDPATGTGTGFTFTDYTPEGIISAVERAVKVFSESETWLKLMRNGMERDFSWNSTVDQVIEVYSEVTENTRASVA